MINKETEDKVKACLSELGLLPSLSSLEQIPGDLSPRRYFRCNLSGDVGDYSSSLIAMVFDSIIPPESESRLIYTSDIAFIELSNFFTKHDLPVPKIFLDRRDIGVLILEDLGNKNLIELLRSNPIEAMAYYLKACQIIKKIQAIPADLSCFAYSRGLDEGVLKKETESFRKYFLNAATDMTHRADIEATLDLICEEVANFEQVLCHRDFHSWNLMVDKENNLRLIDFQDALMGPRSYDLVALLHERDIDYIMAGEDVLKIEDEFFSDCRDSKLREFEYPRVQLQRDIKTIGLFRKCVVERGLPAYGRWIPGNLKRIIGNLRIIADQDQRYSILLNYVEGFLNSSDSVGA